MSISRPEFRILSKSLCLISHPSRLPVSQVIAWSQYPKISMSNSAWLIGSLLIRICGTEFGTRFTISLTGATFSDVPMQISKSHLSMSVLIVLWNNSGRSSPKNVISGFITPKELAYSYRRE
ncbi:hypothetical protein OGAPHI_006245 [Ogataea philodendri]|uniref:Uncharacterized protein n=1 Tax=Ogataea philodendri TaxID=1378263 RepID=A0A9P8NZ01_9ASCO|nr:uncharacterized protein OGAPHI_006245 [Ogataea philodendri]KAH3662064.1 hypothetical protein OGAPHI_006245 [Ogataea philodendri]